MQRFKTLALTALACAVLIPVAITASPAGAPVAVPAATTAALIPAPLPWAAGGGGCLATCDAGLQICSSACFNTDFLDWACELSCQQSWRACTAGC